MPNDSHHVVHNPAGGWDIKRGGGERSSGHFRTKREAVIAAIAMCRNQQTELMVHNMDGTIAYRNSYGNDPRRTRG